MAAQLCKFTKSHLIVHLNMLTLWYVNHFNNATKEGRKEGRERERQRGPTVIHTESTGICTYRNWSWDSTKKHKNFCPHKSDVMNTFEACEFFSLQQIH